MKVNSQVFIAYDIRGVVGTELSDELIEKLGKAIGTKLQRNNLNSLNICRDGRLSGPHISKLFIKGVLSTGCDVYNLNLGPTPLLYYSTFKSSIRNGVMITGSHNPKDYNGFKIVFDQKPLSGESIIELKDLIENEDFISGKGKEIKTPMLEDYKKEIKAKIKLKKNIKAKVIKGWFDDKFQSDCKYDAIVHSHVFEHTYDPHNFIKHISSFLNDGLLIFSVPNMDEMINRGYTNCINFEHTFLLGEPHIEYLLFKNSFEIVRKEYYKDDHSIFYCAKKTKNNITKKCFKDVKDNYQTLFNNYISSHIKDVIEINKKIEDTTLPVFLFGAHVFSQYLISFGLNTDKIVCLLDNDPLKENKRLYGTDLKSFSPKKLKGIGEAIVILRAGVYNNEVKEDISNNINKNIKFI